MFKSAGYTTGAIGKWHLGLGDKTGTQDWNKKASPGPEDLGCLLYTSQCYQFLSVVDFTPDIEPDDLQYYKAEATLLIAY